MLVAKFELTGQFPLLMHWDNIGHADLIAAWLMKPENKKQSKAGDDRTPAWTWHGFVYNDQTHVTMPSDNVARALTVAASKVPSGKGQKTLKEAAAGTLLIRAEHCPLYARGKQVPVAKLNAIRDLPFAEQAEAVKALGFALFVKRARVGQSKHIRVRPRFDDWRVTGEVEVDGPEITADRLKLIFQIAGRGGLGDWRPTAPKSPGPFGQFSAKVEVAERKQVA